MIGGSSIWCSSSKSALIEACIKEHMSNSDNKKNHRHIYYMDVKWCFQRKRNIHGPGRGEEVGQQKPRIGSLQALMAQ